MSVSCKSAGIHRGRQYNQDWKQSSRVQGPHRPALLLRVSLVHPGRTVPHISGRDTGYLHVCLGTLLTREHERD